MLLKSWATPPASLPTDSILLGVEQLRRQSRTLLLGLLALRDVGVGAEHPQRPPRFVVLHDLPEREDPLPIAGLRPLAELDPVLGCLPGDVRAVRPGDGLAVVRVQAFDPPRVRLLELLRGVAEHPGVLRGDDGFAGLDIEVVEALLRRREGEPQPFLALPQGPLGPLSLGDPALEVGGVASPDLVELRVLDSQGREVRERATGVDLGGGDRHRGVHRGDDQRTDAPHPGRERQVQDRAQPPQRGDGRLGLREVGARRVREEHRRPGRDGLTQVGVVGEGDEAQVVGEPRRERGGRRRQPQHVPFAEVDGRGLQRVQARHPVRRRLEDLIELQRGREPPADLEQRRQLPVAIPQRVLLGVLELTLPGHSAPSRKTRRTGRRPRQGPRHMLAHRERGATRTGSAEASR
jgi:hypothetical protein